MNDQTREQRELREILIAAGAGEATPDQLDRLNQLMLSDDQLCEYAILMLQQIGMIRWGGQSAVSASLSAIGACANDGTKPVEIASNAPDHASTSVRRFSVTLAPWLIAGALAASLLAMAFVWPTGLQDQPIVASPAFTPPAPEAVHRGPEVGAGLVQVDAGTIRMRLPHVGYLVVDGPAQFELVNPMRLRLDSGRISVDVTEPSGYGFVVATRDGEVTDLGTRFGVDVTDGLSTGVVVFEGKVDLRLCGATVETPAQRLIGGEGLLFAKNGRLDRIMSIGTGRTATFHRPTDSHLRGELPVIVNVTDTLLRADTKRFYEIVCGGLEEDSLAYVDRPYQWNGISKRGMPKYLRGAQYVKTFNDYKQQSFELTLTIARPADLYLFWDKRVPPAEWLLSAFEPTEDRIGLDASVLPGTNSRSSRRIKSGAGKSIDWRYHIWRKRVETPGKLTLGSLNYDPDEASVSMYGIAAVPLDVANAQDVSEK